MAQAPRDRYVELVEREYFGRVVAPDVDGLLRLFTDDATITVLHGDDPAQVFRADPTPGEQPLRAYFDYVFSSFVVLGYESFEHWVDPEAERCACTFTVVLRLQDQPADSAPLRLRNANFFRLRNGKIADALIYYANPGAST